MYQPGSGDRSNQSLSSASASKEAIVALAIVASDGKLHALELASWHWFQYIGF